MTQRSFDVHIVNAFTENNAGGNAAGVMLEADWMTHAQKLEAARQVGLSETAFVSSSNIATIKLEFFTPTKQIAHCGHATIATFSLLRELGVVGAGQHTKETIDGTRRIQVSANIVLMEQRAPTYRSVTRGSDLSRRVAESLNMSEANVHAIADPVVADTGNAFLIVAFDDERAVAQVNPDQSLIADISEELNLVGYYLFSKSTRLTGRHAGTRMFAPRYGIAEESATGTAAGPLACVLHDFFDVADTEFRIEQGWLMQPASPSLLEAELRLDAGKPAGVWVGGAAKVERVVGLAV